jgi:hypothetical protein
MDHDLRGAPLREVPSSVVRGAVRGAVSLHLTATGFEVRRLPGEAYSQFADEAIRNMSQQASGVRLEFETAADRIELEVLLTRPLAAGTPFDARPPVFVAVVDGRVVDSVTVLDGNLIWLDGESQREVPGAPVRIELSLGEADPVVARRVEVWLPHTAWVELRALRSSAPVEPARPRDRIRWVHHGSSISHCGDADGPLGTWPVVAAQALDFDLTNLGFGGNAMLDPFTARTIRELPAELITLKLGINIVNGDAMTRRTFVPSLHGFLDTVRDGHPLTPIVVITPIACPVHENQPGPTEGDPDAAGLLRARPRPDAVGRLTLGAVREAIAEVVEVRRPADDRLYFLDGRELLGEADAHRLHDRLHPDAAGYRLMGERFAALALAPDSALSAAIQFNI